MIVIIGVKTSLRCKQVERSIFREYEHNIRPRFVNLLINYSMGNAVFGVIIIEHCKYVRDHDEYGL